jgi:hypothetical protein
MWELLGVRGGVFERFVNHWEDEPVTMHRILIVGRRCK